jgi:hypothetical protein
MTMPLIAVASWVSGRCFWIGTVRLVDGGGVNVALGFNVVLHPSFLSYLTMGLLLAPFAKVLRPAFICS